MIVVTDHRAAHRFEAHEGETLAGADHMRTSELVAHPQYAHLEYRAASKATDGRRPTDNSQERIR